MKRKAQARMTETIAVIFIFFILILFGLIFYARYSQSSFVQKQEELLAKEAIDSTTKALFLPELICSKGEAEPEDHCLDLMKLRTANETFRKYLTDYYFNIFSYARITVQEVYPDDRSWILYERIKTNATREEPTYFSVSLREETPDPVYGFGYIEVRVFS